MKRCNKEAYRLLALTAKLSHNLFGNIGILKMPTTENERNLLKAIVYRLRVKLDTKNVVLDEAFEAVETEWASEPTEQQAVMVRVRRLRVRPMMEQPGSSCRDS